MHLNSYRWWTCLYAWDSLKETTGDSCDSESDDDDNDENDDDHPNEDDRSYVLSSVIQEVCDDEPIQIATDIKNIMNNKLVEKDKGLYCTLVLLFSFCDLSTINDLF